MMPHGPLRIVQISNNYKPAWHTGGTCRVSYDLSCSLVKCGHAVSVLTTDWGSEGQVPTNQWVNVDKAQVIYYHNWVPISLFGKVPIPLHPLMAGLDVVSEADVVHLHEYRSALSLMVASKCRKNNIPYVIQLHGSFSHNIGKGRQKQLFDRLIGQSLMDGASKIIALTGSEADLMKYAGTPEDRIAVIPNGINMDDYRILPTRGTFRTAHGIPDGRMVLYLGRLHRTKGIDVLIQAFFQSLRGERATLVIVGPDEGERPRLERMVQDLGISKQVRFVGYVDTSTKLAALADADVVVCPSYTGFPIIFLEAMACGRPVVTTTNGDRLDWLDGQVGVVTDYTAEGLGDGIRNLLDNDRLRTKMGKGGQRMVANEFTLERVAESLVELYRSISADGGAHENEAY